MIIVKQIKVFILMLGVYRVFLAVAKGSFITEKLKQLRKIIKLQQIQWLIKEILNLGAMVDILHQMIFLEMKMLYNQVALKFARQAGVQSK